MVHVVFETMVVCNRRALFAFSWCTAVVWSKSAPELRLTYRHYMCDMRTLGPPLCLVAHNRSLLFFNIMKQEIGFAWLGKTGLRVLPGAANSCRAPGACHPVHPSCA